MNYKYYGFLILGIVAVVFGFSYMNSGGDQSQVNNKAPQRETGAVTNIASSGSEPATPRLTFTLNTVDGDSVTEEELLGKPTLLKLGTTYCHVCMLEVPEMKQAYNELGSRSNIVFVLIGASPNQAKAYIAEYEIEYPVYIDQGEVARLFNVLGTPTHVFLGTDGQLKKRQVGFMEASQITSNLSGLL